MDLSIFFDKMELFLQMLGPCICGIEKVLKKKNAIPLFTFNRNFCVRMEIPTLFLGSPELVTALAIAGDLGFNH
jgi:aconitate hydratase